jgi:hypothetical protein
LIAVSAKDKLDADYDELNLKVEQTAQEEIQKIRQNLDALKNQANLIYQTLLQSSSDET